MMHRLARMTAGERDAGAAVLALNMAARCSAQRRLSDALGVSGRRISRARRAVGAFLGPPAWIVVSL
jgi:hypothetical protein